MQQRHGADRLAVVLLSVDPEYFGADDKYIGLASKVLEKQKLDWPNAFLPGGWNEVMHRFNLWGYSKIVVDARGIVRGVGPHGAELEKLIAKPLAEKPAEEPPR